MVALSCKIYRCYTFLIVCCSLDTFQRLSKNCEKRLLALSCLSVCVENWDITVRIFWKLDILSIFLKSFEKIQVPLKSDKNIGHFTLKTSSEDSRSILFSMANISDKSCRGNQSTLCVQ
jgi:hypothetical protein